MGGVTGIDQYASEHLSPYYEEIQIPIQSIYTGIDRISNIVKSLNTYSRTDNYQQTPCTISNVLDDCLIMLQNKWKNRIEISKKYESVSKILVNEGRIHQAFLNIINNSIQAIDDTGHISIKTFERNGKVITEIRDDGTGISPKNIKKIFDPFFTTKEPNEGTGLGLSITQKIISDYNGRITFISEGEEGTTVTVVFPIMKED